ncbi:hypothetical protein K438DRAFT_1973469 [Mycena galopus ATCC 62051]|nr:hypothetical protein K438DRAFT_1973469 [Mycena galopus ATCC 62051]
MDDNIHADAEPAQEYAVTTAEDSTADSPVAFFPSSKQFSISGGIFASKVTNNYHQTSGLPSDFRRIPLGDIDLQREIRQDFTVARLDRRAERKFVRRVYSAKIEGRTSDMTVAIYQGTDSKEEWRQHISKVSSFRDPNILQLYGVATSPSIHAAVYHGDVIPFQHFLDRYRSSHFLTLDLWAFFVQERSVNESPSIPELR